MLTTVDLKRRVEFARYFLPILRKIESEISEEKEKHSSFKRSRPSISGQFRRTFSWTILEKRSLKKIVDNFMNNLETFLDKISVEIRSIRVLNAKS